MSTQKPVPSRWSRTNVHPPAQIETPTSEADIHAILAHAAQRNLKVIPAAGGHGTFVPITQNTIYVDLNPHFSSVSLDEEAGTVTVGGGTTAGTVLRALAAEGWLTCVPNSNAVGMAGFCLAGGSSALNGLRGLAVDNLVRVRLLTAGGEVLTLTPGMAGEHAELFNVLCGAGFGFGVVTELTLRAWPVRELRLDGGTVWTRKLVFAPAGIAAAAGLFARLQDPEPRLSAVLLFMRAPPSAPRPGSPVVVLSVSFFGPADEAEVASAATFEAEFTAQAVVAETGATAVGEMNDMSEPLNRHGDWKENYAAWVDSVPAASVVESFERWVRFGDETPQAKSSYFIIAAKSTGGMLEHDVAEEKFFPRAIRGRKIFAQAVPWWTEEGVEEQSKDWAQKMLSIVRKQGHTGKENDGMLPSDEEQTRITGFAANLSKRIDLSTVWPEQMREDIRRLKEKWDPQGLFWNPVVDGV